MTDLQYLILTAALALSVILTRILPFLIFSKKAEMPKVIDYLGKVLPPAMMGLLVVYCFKDVHFGNFAELLPLLIASITVIGLHLWKRNTILSIVLGTAVYMILIRLM